MTLPDAAVEDLRLAIYRAFAEHGRPPSATGLAALLKIDLGDVAQGLRELDDRRHLALDPSGRIAMAHPFSAVPLGFSVMGATTLWWGGCAWDAFAIPNLVPDETEVLVATRCPSCATAHVWIVDRHAPPAGTQVAHFLVPVAHMWDDVVRTCANQRLFCSRRCVEDWLARSGEELGYVMNLDTLWRLAAHWYDGRLERGYVRREPAAAADYLRGVGLSGSFWGL